MKTIGTVSIALVLGANTPLFAQAPRPGTQVAAQALRDQYEIGQMEGIFQRAAEHGAKETRDLVRSVIPADMLLSDEVRVRGIRLDDYGVFFYVDMPDLQESLPSIYRSLDKNDLGLASAVGELRALVEAAGSANGRQALQRLELQLGPSVSRTSVQSQRTPIGPNGTNAPPLSASAQSVSGSAASVNVNADPAPASPAVDAILSNPQGVYRERVSEALIEAMLDHSNGLRLDAKDWLTVAARGKESPVRLSQADSESPTIVISVRGEVLIALLAKQITREEARKQVVVRVN